jgi:hypothetical protein
MESLKICWNYQYKLQIINKFLLKFHKLGWNPLKPGLDSFYLTSYLSKFT